MGARAFFGPSPVTLAKLQLCVLNGRPRFSPCATVAETSADLSRTPDPDALPTGVSPGTDPALRSS